jgi:hypothetical protein
VIVGDISGGDVFERFIEAFGPLIIERYRSKLLDRTFGDQVVYYVGVDEMSATVRLYAVVWADIAEEFTVVGAPSFFPGAEEDDLLQQVVSAFALDEEEARRQLQKASFLGGAHG